MFYSNVNAEVLNNIIIKGNKRISEETIKVYGEIEIGKNLKESDLNKILKNLYSTDFLKIVSLDLNNQTLTINLKEYILINLQ